MVRQYLLVAMLGFFISVSTITLADRSCLELQYIFGEYTTVEISRYRGGLTSLGEAEQRIGKSVEVFKDVFSLWEEAHYETPLYELACHSITQAEGEVPSLSERVLSRFYGYGLDRDTVELLNVSSYNNDDGFDYVFEIVDDELWFFFDGFFYRMKRKF